MPVFRTPQAATTIQQPQERGKKNKGRPSGLFSPPRTRSNRNTTPEFQAQADRMEEVRDLEDLDYHQSKTTLSQRPGSADTTPKSGKKANPGHVPYEHLKKRNIKQERMRHLSRIRKDWGRDPKQWMPHSVWPCKIVRLGGNHKERHLIGEPRDWNTPLLVELSYLSAVTKGKPNTAYRALEEAMSRRQRAEDSNEDIQLHKEDIQLATQICKMTGPSQSSQPNDPNRPVPVPVPALTDDGVAEAESPAAVVAMSEASHGLPALRSPTLAGDVAPIKLETQPPGRADVMENVLGGAWTGFDEEMEKLEEQELEAEELEAIAAAKRKRREVIAHRRRIREELRQHGGNSGDAILLRSE